MLYGNLGKMLFRIYEPEIGTGVQMRQLTFCGLQGQFVEVLGLNWSALV
jgi:hypothetical protein